jgi:hypothetical protein
LLDREGAGVDADVADGGAVEEFRFGGGSGGGFAEAFGGLSAQRVARLGPALAAAAALDPAQQLRGTGVQPAHRDVR